MDIVPIKKTDLDVISFVHSKAFPDAALTKFGKKAIQLYYLWYIDHLEDSLCIKAIENDAVLGFCFAGVFSDSEFGFIRHNRKYLFMRMLSHPWLIFNDIVRKRLSLGIKAMKIGNLFIKKRTSIVLPRKSITERLGVLAIATDPDYQKSGVGKKMMQYIEEFARERDYSSIRLSVHQNNERAISFYEKMGWVKVFSDNGNWEGIMRKNL